MSKFASCFIAAFCMKQKLRSSASAKFITVNAAASSAVSNLAPAARRAE